MPSLLDQFGRPLEREVLTEPQTSRTAWLHQTFAAHPSRGLTPQKLARILEDAERGDFLAQYDLCEDMEEKDGHILAELSKRKRAMLSLPWDIVPPRNPSAAETKMAAALKEQLLDIPNFEDVLLDMADAIGKGFAALEIEWGRIGSAWLAQKLCLRPQQWFQLDQATHSEIRLRDNSADGAELLPFGWVFHVHKARSGYIARSGLHRALVWPYLFKNYAVRDCAEFLEIYGLPVRIGKYPSGAGDKEKSALLAAVVGIGHSAAGIIPETMALEFLEAAKGTHEPFAFLVDWCERTESKVILGQTTSSEAKSTGLGSGVADLHAEVRRDIRDADAVQLAGTLTRDLVYPLAALNLGLSDPRRSPRWVFDTQEPEDLKSLAESLPQLVSIGVKIPVAWVHERLKLPVPAEGEDVLAIARAPAPGPDDDAPDNEDSPRAAARAALAAQLPPAPRDALDELVEDALSEWQTPIQALIAPIRVALDEAMARGETIEAFRARLPDLLPQMDVGPQRERLAQAAFIAALAGQADIDLDRR